MSPNFLIRSKNYLTNYIKAYGKYSSVAAIDLVIRFWKPGKTQGFLTNLAATAKSIFSGLIYAYLKF